MPKPVNKLDLDSMPCGGCGQIGQHPTIFNQACHPGEGVTAEYWDGVITIKCDTCEEIVIEVQVAEGELN